MTTKKSRIDVNSAFARAEQYFSVEYPGVYFKRAISTTEVQMGKWVLCDEMFILEGFANLNNVEEFMRMHGIFSDSEMLVP